MARFTSCLPFHLTPFPSFVQLPTLNLQPTKPSINQQTNKATSHLIPLLSPHDRVSTKKEMLSYVDKRACLRSGSSGRHSEVPEAQSADRGGGGSSAQIAEVQGVRQRVARQIDRGALVDARERARGRDGRLRRRHLLPSVAAASGLLRDRRRAGARPAVDDR